MESHFRLIHLKKCPEYLRMYTPPETTHEHLMGNQNRASFSKVSIFPSHIFIKLVKKHTAHAILLAMQRSQNRKPRRVPSATFQKSLVACIFNLDCPVIPLQQTCIERCVSSREHSMALNTNRSTGDIFPGSNQALA